MTTHADHAPTTKPPAARRSYRAAGPDGSFFQTTTKLAERRYTHAVIARRVRTGDWTDLAWCESAESADARARNERQRVSTFDDVRTVAAVETASLVTYVTTALVFGERRQRQGVSTPLPTFALGIRSSRGAEPVSWFSTRALADEAAAKWRKQFPEAVDAELSIVPAATRVLGSRR